MKFSNQFVLFFSQKTNQKVFSMASNSNFSWNNLLKYVLLFLIILGFFYFPKFFKIENEQAFQITGLICAVILFLYLILVDYWGRKKDKYTLRDRDEKSRNRTFIAIVMVTVGILIIIGFGILVFFSVYSSNAKDEDAAKWVFNATIPLVASWIGTVLAFYFGRENFESATDRILQFSRESLDDIYVERMMISKKTMLNLIYKDEKTLNLAEENLPKLEDILKFYKSNGKDRVPILDENSYPLYVVHITTLGQEKNTLSFKQFLELPKNEKLYGYNQDKGFVTVKPNTTLDEATKLMLKIPDCKDIFITEDGTNESEVLGWIPDSTATRFVSFKRY